MSDRLLIITGSLLIGVSLALIQTYKSYEIYIEAVMTILATVGTILSLIAFFKNK